MKANELRVGNWVVIPTYTTPHEVQSIRWDGIGEGVDKAGDLCCEYDWVDIEPIPLTEEWLKRFGFWQTAPSIFESNKFNNHEWLELDRDDGFNVFYRQNNLGAGEDVVLLGNPLKHVHQLQNLYFALTGDELQCK